MPIGAELGTISRATPALLSALPTAYQGAGALRSAFDVGQEAFVESNGFTYALQTSSATVDGTTTLSVCDDSTKRWIKVGGSSTGITTITSTGATVTITNPTGPTTNLEVAVSSVADWTVGISRVYAVDGVNGNDANLGYATPATTSLADYAIACAAAGAVAKRTLTGVGAIIPRIGSNRRFEIVIANGGANTAATYAEDLSVAIAGCEGYSRINVRATGTNTTAGVVAFDGSAADCAYMGWITAPGMNAAGYNPTGTPNTYVVQCLKVGGGAPAFAAEAAAVMPLGASMRFDANTATVALRNARRVVSKVAGTDTLSTGGTIPWPAVPTAADVFYIEQPGATVLSLTVGNLVPSTSSGVQVSGLGTTGGISLATGGYWTVAGCWTGTFLNFTDGRISVGGFYSHQVRGNIQNCGATRVGSSTSFSNCSVSGFQGFWGVGTLSVTSCFNFSWTAGCGIGSISTWNANYFQTVVGNSYIPFIGGVAALTAGTVPRFLGQFDFVGGGSYAMGQCEINDSRGSQSGCIVVRGNGTLLDLACAQANTSLTGGTVYANIGWGIYIEGTLLAPDCPSDNTIRLYAPVPPAFTGGVAQVQLQSTVTTWAQMAKGFVDQSNNRFEPQYGTNTAPIIPNTPTLFSGTLVGGAGAVFSYFANAGAAAANNVQPYKFPGVGSFLCGLDVQPLVNTLTHSAVFTLYINGVASTTTVTITAGSLVRATQFGSVGPLVICARDDFFDLRADSAGADVGNTLTFSARLLTNS